VSLFLGGEGEIREREAEFMLKFSCMKKQCVAFDVADRESFQHDHMAPLNPAPPGIVSGALSRPIMTLFVQNIVKGVFKRSKFQNFEVSEPRT
jgi:hypothetical protein